MLPPRFLAPAVIAPRFFVALAAALELTNALLLWDRLAVVLMLSLLDYTTQRPAAELASALIVPPAVESPAVAHPFLLRPTFRFLIGEIDESRSFVVRWPELVLC